MANHGQALQLRNIRPEKTTAYTVRTENWVISDDQATAVSATSYAHYFSSVLSLGIMSSALVSIALWTEHSKKLETLTLVFQTLVWSSLKTRPNF
jgi:hypothetical protein